MANLINETKKNTNGMAVELANKVHDSKNYVNDLVYDSGEKIGHMASDVANSAIDSFKSGREYVKDHPYQGFAMATLIGMLSGVLLTVLMRRR
jgi:ElaB/YqjD/DUF883 family membrane-anchored ribosome-binding protein